MATGGLDSQSGSLPAVTRRDDDFGESKKFAFGSPNVSADEMGDTMHETNSKADSDGFVEEGMDAVDFEGLSLEEKILCGFYQAKPSNSEAYPITYLNIPKGKEQ